MGRILVHGKSFENNLEIQCHPVCNPLYVWVRYGVAMIGRLLKIIGLFCRISSLLYGSFAKETYHLHTAEYVQLEGQSYWGGYG